MIADHRTGPVDYERLQQQDDLSDRAGISGTRPFDKIEDPASEIH